MTREEKFDAIVERIKKPENYEKYQTLLNGESKLYWHCKRAEDSLEALSNESSNAHDSLLESDFDVSIQEIKRIMDTEGWK